MKSTTKAIAYTQKDDPQPLIIGVLPLASQKKQVSAEVAKILLEGGSLQDVNAVAPGFLLLNFKKIQYFRWWATREREKATKLPWATLVAPAESTTPEIFLINWLNKNIKKERHFKQRQLLLQAPPDFRKTGLVQMLDKYLTILYAPTLEDFLDEWEENTYDLLVFDEWCYHQHNPQFLNQLLDGQKMNVRIKGGQVRKQDKVPVIILTNETQMESFGKGVSFSNRATLLTRLHWVILSRPLPLETIFGNPIGGAPGMDELHGSEPTTILTGDLMTSTGTQVDQENEILDNEDEEELRRRTREGKEEEEDDHEIIDLTGIDDSDYSDLD